MTHGNNITKETWVNHFKNLLNGPPGPLQIPQCNPNDMPDELVTENMLKEARHMDLTFFLWST